MSALPESWVECSFASIARVVSGKNQKEVEDPLGAYPIYGSGGTFGRASDYICEAGTTVIGRKGTINSPIFVNERFWNVDTAFGLCPIDAKSLLPRLLFYYCQSFNFHSLDKSTTIPSLAKRDIEFIRFPLPPLAEQKRIVAKIEELFSELDAGEESLRRARRQLGVYRQSLLKQAFEGKLTEQWRKQNPHLLESPEQLLTRIQTERQAEYAKQLREWEKAKQTHKRASKPSEPKLMDGLAAKEIARIDPPNGWATEKIGNCPTDSLIGLVRAATEQSSDPTGVSYIKMDRVDMLGNVDLSADVFVACTEEEIERFQLRQGDILFNTRNSVELVGKTAVVRRDPTVPTVYNNNLMRIRLPDSLDPTFVGLQMCAKPFRQRMEQVKKATTSVAAIYGKDFWPLGITFPSLPEQCEIVRLLDEQFTVIEQNEREIDAALKRSAALRQSILKKAFTGQLVPQDPTDEPASALLERIRKERDTGSVSKKKTALKKAKPI
jgi:type I restriction enzyme S subunit